MSVSTGVNAVHAQVLARGITTAATIYWVAPWAGTLSALKVVDSADVTPSDTNYMTVAAVNVGSAGTGNTSMASATTKTTGGLAFSAHVATSITLSTTAANLKFSAGDVIKVTATAAASGTFTGASIQLDAIPGQG